MDYEKEVVVKRAFKIAAAFVGWVLIVVLLMMGFYQFTVSLMGWEGWASGPVFAILGLILIIAPPAIVWTHIDDNK